MVPLISFIIGSLYAFASFRLTKSKPYAVLALVVTGLALAFGQLYSIHAPEGMGGMLAMIVGSIFVLLNPATVSARRIGGGMLAFASVAFACVIFEGWDALTWFPRYGGLAVAAFMLVGGIFSISHKGRLQ